MTLFLGKIGRRIVDFTVKHPRLNQAVNAFSKKDSVYRNGKKIAGNEYIPELISRNGPPTEFERIEANTPEVPVEHCRSTFQHSSLRQVALYTSLFALPDIIFRAAVNMLILPKDNLIQCVGWFRGTETEIRWEFMPKDRIFYSLLDFSPGTCQDYIPNGYSGNDFYLSSFSEGAATPFLEAKSYGLVNYHHYGHVGLLEGMVALGIMGTYYCLNNINLASSKLLLRLSMGLMAAAGLVQFSELLMNGFATDYFLMPHIGAVNLADVYSLFAPLFLIKIILPTSKADVLNSNKSCGIQ